MQIRILGEDLIRFRNGRGEPGLPYPQCVHRGTSLYYGQCEDDGIRCCYHGRKFAPDGTCLDQPCEPKQASYPIARGDIRPHSGHSGGRIGFWQLAVAHRFGEPEIRPQGWFLATSAQLAAYPGLAFHLASPVPMDDPKG